MFETLLRELRSVLDHVSYTGESLTDDEKDSLWEIEKLVDEQLYPDLPIDQYNDHQRHAYF